MITRFLALRHGMCIERLSGDADHGAGRSAIARPSSTISIRQWRRTLSTTTRRAAQTTADNASKDGITADWEFFQHQRALTGNVGASITPQYKPSNLIKRPPRPEDITLELLLASQTHLGHRTSLWHPANARYIFGTWGQAHDAIHVISLDVTASHLRRACKIVSGVAAKGGIILFVGTRDGHALPVVRAAEMAGGCHLFDKWIPGTLTNSQQILGKCAKKVVNEVDEDLLGFENQLPQRAALKPDLVVCLNPLENYILLHECGQHNIPTIGIIDTDVNPTWVTYPIPANDDSLRSVSVIAGALGVAGEAGQQLRLERAKAGSIDFAPAKDLRVPTKDEIQASKRLKNRSAFEDQDDDGDDDILTPQEVALYAQEPAAQQSASKRDDTEELSFHNDDELADLTGLSEENSSTSSLSQKELGLLERSMQQSAVQSAENIAVDDVSVDQEAVSHAGKTDDATVRDVDRASNKDLSAYEDAIFTDSQSETSLPSGMSDEEMLQLLSESTQHPTGGQRRASAADSQDESSPATLAESVQNTDTVEADSSTPTISVQGEGSTKDEDPTQKQESTEGQATDGTDKPSKV